MTSLSPQTSKAHPFRLAPETAPCPRCGSYSSRNEVRRLERWAGNLEAPEQVSVEVGCYLCPRCPDGERWFRLEPPGFEGWRNYTTSTRFALISLVVDHKLSYEGTAAIGRALLHLPELAATTVMRWHREAGHQVDYRRHIERMADIFSGQLAIDEVYDGGYYVIKVTDPLNGTEITNRFGDGSPGKGDIIEVLTELKDAGFAPLLIVTDGSNLYPDAIREVFPDAEHQRCVFHFIQGVLKNLSKAFWTAYETMPEPKKRKRGRPKKRGRPRLDKVKRANRDQVRGVRFLVFKRQPSPSEQEAIAEAIALCPPLATVRRLVEAIYELFGPTTQTHELAEARRQAILADEELTSTTSFGGVLRDLADDDFFGRLTRYLDFENADKTSNHPERENREFRKRQRSHYRLRSVESLCAFLDLLLVRRPPPPTPRRLNRRRPTAPLDAEVLAA